MQGAPRALSRGGWLVWRVLTPDGSAEWHLRAHAAITNGVNRPRDLRAPGASQSRSLQPQSQSRGDPGTVISRFDLRAPYAWPGARQNRTRCFGDRGRLGGLWVGWRLAACERRRAVCRGLRDVPLAHRTAVAAPSGWRSARAAHDACSDARVRARDARTSQAELGAAPGRRRLRPSRRGARCVS